MKASSVPPADSAGAFACPSVSSNGARTSTTTIRSESLSVFSVGHIPQLNREALPGNTARNADDDSTSRPSSLSPSKGRRLSGQEILQGLLESVPIGSASVGDC